MGELTQKLVQRAGLVFVPALWIVVLVGILSGWFAPLDNALRDWRFGLTTRAATGSVVFVDIDSASLASVGVWPWPRQLHAQMLDALMRMGADNVVFDVDFSATSSEADDAAFEHSLADAGGYAYLAAFEQQRLVNGPQSYNLPLDRFRKNAAPVAVNVSLDSGGLVRTYPLAVDIAGQSIPSVAELLSGRTGPAEGVIDIDFSIDPTTVTRISASALLSGKVDPALLNGKDVVIGASAVELRDFFVVPRYGIIPGALLQILAAETLKQNRALTPLGFWPILAAVLLLGLFAFLLSRRLPVWGVVLLGTLVLAAAEAIAALLQMQVGLMLDTAAVDVALGVVGLQALIVELKRSGEQRRVAHERLRYLARHDPLTGALSRTTLVEQIDAALATGRDVAVVALDLRRFRAINDTLGHGQGDQLLKLVAARLTEMGPDAVARLGGDSFAMLAPDMPADRLVGFCQAIIEWLSFPYELSGEHQVMIAASAGATMSSLSGRDAETLLSHADMALSAAKQRTGSAVALYEPEMAERLGARQAMDAALRWALARREISVAYQPQIDLGTSRIIGAEALARWDNPLIGSVSPVQFIAAAEETGLIVEIGRWMLDAACMEAARWPEELRIAVNVSPVQLELCDVAADVAKALERSGLSPARLDIEITEGVFVKNADAAIEKLNAVRRLGAGIALDDFGTGYSSLSYLAKLPVDKIKIDQSFVRRLPVDREALAIVRAVVSLSDGLGKAVVAEGIETPEQAALLIAAGCRIAQGFLFGRPMSGEDIRRSFASQSLSLVG